MTLIDDLCKKYKIKKKDIIVRSDGRIEWLCEHGVGHPIYAPNDNYIHGCNGNCIVLFYHKKVKGFEKYLVNRKGDIFNTKLNRRMTPHEKDGYLWMQLNENGKRKYKSVHRMVAEAYIPNPENKRCINHKDFNRKNNHYLNLEWVTDSENLNHTYKNGRGETQRENCKKLGIKCRKLSIEDVRKIFEFKNEGMTNIHIAEYFKVHKETISRIIRGITYKNILDELNSELK